MSDSPKKCKNCEQPFVPVRRGNAYCSGRCRVAAHRQRNATVTPLVARPAADPPDVMLKAVDRIIALARTIAARNPRRRKLVALMRKFVVGAEPIRARWLAASKQSEPRT